MHGALAQAHGDPRPACQAACGDSRVRAPGWGLAAGGWGLGAAARADRAGSEGRPPALLGGQCDAREEDAVGGGAAGGGVGGGALGREPRAGQTAPGGAAVPPPSPSPGGSAREPCNPEAGSALLRPSPAPGLARQRGHDEEAVQSHAPAGQPDGGQVGHPRAARGRCAPAGLHSRGAQVMEPSGLLPSLLPSLPPRRPIQGSTPRSDPSFLNFPDPGALLSSCQPAPSYCFQAHSVTHPLPASPAAPSPRPPRLSPGLPSPSGRESS
jgi:hypothetical protein